MPTGNLIKVAILIALVIAAGGCDETDPRISSERSHGRSQPSNTISESNTSVESKSFDTDHNQVIAADPKEASFGSELARPDKAKMDIADTRDPGHAGSQRTPAFEEQYSKSGPIVDLPETEHSELNREFAESLGAFDEYLRDELESSEKQESEQAEDQQQTGLEAAAAQAMERLAEKGIDVNSGENAENGEGSEGAPPANESGEVSETVAAGDSSKQPEGEVRSPSGTQGPPGAGTDSADDDIVARQLREAAEKETDPVLKKKLWDEYYAYKGVPNPETEPAPDE